MGILKNPIRVFSDCHLIIAVLQWLGPLQWILALAMRCQPGMDRYYAHAPKFDNFCSEDTSAIHGTNSYTKQNFNRRNEAIKAHVSLLLYKISFTQKIK